MITVKKLAVFEIGILTKLFKYNDEKAAIAENKQMVESGIADIFCIFDGTEPFGELRVKYKSDENGFTREGIRVYLYAFRINKEYRGKGFGKILMQKVIEFLEKQGYSEFTIGVEDKNVRAKHIYDCFGFTKIIARRFEEYQGTKYYYSLYLKS